MPSPKPPFEAPKCLGFSSVRPDQGTYLQGLRPVYDDPEAFFMRDVPGFLCTCHVPQGAEKSRSSQ